MSLSKASTLCRVARRSAPILRASLARHSEGSVSLGRLSSVAHDGTHVRGKGSRLRPALGFNTGSLTRKGVRTRSLLTSKMNDAELKHLERTAASKPDDASAEAAFMKALANSYPESAMDRFESEQFVTSPEITSAYLKAAAHSGETSRAVEFLEDNMKGNLSMSRRPKFGQADLLHSLGDARTPLHVKISGNETFRAKVMSAILSVLRTFLFVTILLSVMEMATGSKLGIPGSNVRVAEHSDKRFTDVVGIDEAKSELEEIVLYLKNPGLFTRLGGKLPRGLMLTGPPGTGKTLLAKAIAGEAGVPFYYTSGSEFEEMFVGVGAKRVRELFGAAKKTSPCIIFIDEIDAVGGTRHLKDQSAMKMTLNQLLVEMDGFEENSGIIVIAATNFPEGLDKALTRPGRFDKQIPVPLPDVGGREAILKLYAGRTKLEPGANLNALARGTAGMSGADLYNLVNQAAVKASLDGAKAVTTEALEWARDKISMGPERRSAVISKETATLTAYHEGGHALVAVKTDGAVPVHKATIMPRGQALGWVMQLPDGDQTSITRKELMARMDVCMGGRAAEELIFGTDNITTGAASDLQQASNIAKMMVTQSGMSDKVGKLYVNDAARQGGEMRAAIDAEVKRLVDEAYERAKACLKSNKEDLEILAKALLKHETLTGAQIMDVLARKDISTTPSGDPGNPFDSRASTSKGPRERQRRLAGAKAVATKAAASAASTLPKADPANGSQQNQRNAAP